MEEVHSSSNVFLLLLATSLAFTSFVFPSFPNLTSQIFPAHAVKKSWDCLILALVLFAIACGFLRSSGSYRRSDTQKSSLSYPITLDECYYSYDLGREYRFSLGSFGRTIGSGRCPDLWAQDEGRWRLYDHTNPDAGQGFGSKPVHSRRILKGDCDDEEKKLQREHVVANDSCDHNAAVEEMEVAVTLPPSALPGARAAPKERKARRTFQTILYKPKDDVHKPPAALQVPQPLPPPVFHTQLASKKGKTRVDLSAPPPVPLPPAALHKKKSHTPVTMPPNYESSGDSDNMGGLSPMPPPRPPFKVPSWRFAMRGHHVWIKSPNAWRHKSPDAEDYEDSVSETTESASYSSSEATSPAFCPSSDVNKRAGKFIATFKARLNQKKTSSMKQRRSNLGPEIIG
ncbi:uncharacterized protein LOC115692903 [Syzygium oleosum]|uniref:uncharacterized protein LOC115692903 n=1 Tax=Syzygium oleosum TaxID=219896 RepID=UPI0011D1C473|nr:uncharacterized protein LOC115692903 [Syzygium oleosum]